MFTWYYCLVAVQVPVLRLELDDFFSVFVGLRDPDQDLELCVQVSLLEGFKKPVKPDGVTNLLQVRVLLDPFRRNVLNLLLNTV